MKGLLILMVGCAQKKGLIGKPVEGEYMATRVESVRNVDLCRRGRRTERSRKRSHPVAR